MSAYALFADLNCANLLLAKQTTTNAFAIISSMLIIAKLANVAFT